MPQADGRRILIFPEGHLCKAGERFRYRTGVYYMYRDFDLPVVPVATNLGCFWPQQDFVKNAGRGEFLERLEETVETRSQELICAARGEDFRESVKAPAPDEVERAATQARAIA